MLVPLAVIWLSIFIKSQAYVYEKNEYIVVDSTTCLWQEIETNEMIKKIRDEHLSLKKCKHNENNHLTLVQINMPFAAYQHFRKCTS